MIKKLLIGFGILLILALSGAIYYFLPQAGVATGYAAKKMCSCTFATDRLPDEVAKNDLYFSVLPQVKNVIDKIEKSVTSSLFGLATKKAVFRPGIGCILLEGIDDYNVTFPKIETSESVPDIFNNQPLITQGVDIPRLWSTIEQYFSTFGSLDSLQTTAIVVIHRDTLIAEKYAPPFDKDMPQLGWSMTKSLMNAYAGLLTKDGTFSIAKTQLFDEWSGDDRRDISLKNLLQMNTGLRWEENYATDSDATRMLFKAEDVSLIPLACPLSHERGKYWAYSSGTSNILSKYFRNILADDTKYLTFLKTRLFDVIGMNSAFIETDESGTLIGSSYGYATPRDWAKFGLLYLHDGVWNGKRLLPDGWVKFTKDTAEGSDGKYGAQFWLNKNGSQYPDAPYDMLIADGFLGQWVFIIPEYDAVIVRMGTGKKHFDPNDFLNKILKSIPTKE